MSVRESDTFKAALFLFAGYWLFQVDYDQDNRTTEYVF
jgi:hypothetical protein